MEWEPVNSQNPIDMPLYCLKGPNFKPKKLDLKKLERLGLRYMPLECKISVHPRKRKVSENGMDFKKFLSLLVKAWGLLIHVCGNFSGRAACKLFVCVWVHWFWIKSSGNSSHIKLVGLINCNLAPAVQQYRQQAPGLVVGRQGS